MRKISWFTPGSVDITGTNWYSQGYSTAAIATINALKEKDVAVFYNRNEIPYHVNFCQPYYYQYQNSYKVGYTPWESTKIPSGWIDHMRQCDEIWATSNYVKEIYEKHQVHHNIHVIPHGISDEFAIIDREIINTFNFLHVGGDSKRKNAQMAVDAFLELYEGNMDFKLYLKYTNFCFAEVYLNGRLVPASMHPQIVAIPNSYDIESLVKLYHSCHCMIYPTNGEGFGMIPFESICTGMPTIVTNETGCKDFANYSIPLDAEFTFAEWNTQQYGEDTGMWASPDFEQLLELMEVVVNEYDDFKKHTIKSAKILHTEQSWSAIADKIVDRIKYYEECI